MLPQTLQSQLQTHRNMLLFKTVLGAIGLGFCLLYHQIRFSGEFFSLLD